MYYELFIERCNQNMKKEKCVDYVGLYKEHLVISKGAREWRNVPELLKLDLKSSHYLQSFIFFNSKFSRHHCTRLKRRRRWQTSTKITIICFTLYLAFYSLHLSLFYLYTYFYIVISMLELSGTGISFGINKVLSYLILSSLYSQVGRQLSELARKDGK